MAEFRRSTQVGCALLFVLTAFVPLASADAGVMTGTVVTPSGDPVAGAEVTLVREEIDAEGTFTLVPTGEPAVAGPDGSFRLAWDPAAFGLGAVTDAGTALLPVHEPAAPVTLVLAADAADDGAATFSAPVELDPVAKPTVDVTFPETPSGGEAAITTLPPLRAPDVLPETPPVPHPVPGTEPITMTTGGGGPTGLTVYVNNAAYWWVPYVPLPADFDGDLVTEATVTVLPRSQGFCIWVDRWVNTGATGFRVGIGTDEGKLLLRGNEIPSTITLCGHATAGKGTVTFESPRPKGHLAARMTGEGVDFSVALDEMPAEMSLVVDAYDKEAYAIEYSADRELAAKIMVTEPETLVAQITRIPTDFDATFWRTPRNMGSGITATDAHFDYSASAGIDRIAFQFGDEASPTRVTAALEDVPASFSTTVHWRQKEIVYYVDYTQSASSTLGRVQFYAKAGNDPLYVEAYDLPARVDKALLRLEDWGATTRYSLQTEMSGDVRNLFVNFGRDGSFHQFQLFATRVPANLWGLVYATTSGETLDSAFYYHQASSGVPDIRFYGRFDGGQVAITGQLTDVPARAFVSTNLAGHSKAAVAPSLTVSASASGLDLYFDIRGNALGSGAAYATVFAQDAPSSFTTTKESHNNANVVIKFETPGAERLRLLYVAANLPAALKDAPFSDFYVYARDLGDFTLRDSKALTDAFCGPQLYLDCQYFPEREASYVEIYHGMAVLNFDWLTVGADLRYRGEQLEWHYKWWCSCWVPDYVTKYVVNQKNLSVYAPQYFSDNAYVRSAGKKW